jgi:AcrR family transcriptional regulator
MATRAAAAEATRSAILDAASGLFLDGWYDEVTLAGIARAAGVSGQTVLNHFGGKEQVFGAAIDRMSEGVQARRNAVTPGDVAGALSVLLDDYEETGDAVFRLLAVEERLPAVRPALARGREGHRDWVERIFGRPDRVGELIAATDVFTWKLLRRDQSRSREETERIMRGLVEAVLAYDPTRRSR